MRMLCGQCGKSFEAEAAPGHEVACPHCANRIIVPDFAAKPPPAPPVQAGSTLRRTPAEISDGGFADMARQSMSRRVRVVCGKCGKVLTLGVRLSGKRAKCPSCSTMIQIPYPDEKDQELESIKQVDEDELEVFEPQEEPPKTESTASAGRGSWVKWTVAMLLIVGAVSAIVTFVLPEHSQQSPTSTSAGKPGAGGGPAVQAPVTPSANPGVPAKLIVGAATADLFAAEGYYPALPDLTYIKVTVTLTAGGTPLPVETDGADVVLREGEATYRSLGLVPKDFLVPVRSLREQFTLEPGQSKAMTLLFQVPRRMAKADLAVGSLWGQVQLPPQEKDVPAAALAGSFAEKPPRNLQPLLRHPVMAAVQAAVNQTLVATPAGGGFAVQIPAAGAAGEFKSIGSSCYKGLLQVGAASLACKLRLAEGGQVLILYLSEDPFHQLTYERKP